jgi:hypothetical protein
MKKVLALVVILICLSTVFAESFNISAYNAFPKPETFYQVLFQYQNYVTIFDTETSEYMENKTYDMNKYINVQNLQNGILSMNSTLAFKVAFKTNMVTPIVIELQIYPFTTIAPVGVNQEYRTIPTKFASDSRNNIPGTMNVTINGDTYTYTSTASVKDQNGTPIGTSGFTISGLTPKTVYIHNDITASINGNPVDLSQVKEENNTLKGIGDNVLQSSLKLNIGITNYDADNVEKNIDYVSTIRVTIEGT